MDKKEAQDGRELFSSPEDDEILEGIVEKKEEDRPISQVMTDIEPGGRKTHRWFMSPKHQTLAIGTGFLAVGLLAHWIIFGGQRPKAVVTREQKEIAALKKKVAYFEGQGQTKTRENSALTQGAQFEAIPMEGQPDPKKDGAFQVSNRQTPPTATPTPPRPPATNRRPVTARNTVPVPRRTYTPSPRLPQARRPPISTFRQQTKAQSAPSLNNCVEFVQSGVNVPACGRYKISLKQTPASKPITLGQTPKPAIARNPTPFKRPAKPVLTAYAQPKASQTKPDYQVNFMAGEIQTMDQYQEEMYGSGQKTGKATLVPAKFTARVIDHVEWTSPQEAQQIVIPLVITSGQLQGQEAEAKITSLNGVQFTAQLTTLNGQEVEPGAYELRKKNTKYLRAQHKRQGGSNLGNRLLGTVAAIGGEIASDQLANVRGGNHISGLVPRAGQSRQQITQYWKFDGNVEIVKK